MRVVLRRLETMGELTIADDDIVNTDCVTIGRGTDQHIQIPDMRLALAHSEIRCPRPGEYLVDSKTRAGTWVNGVPAPFHPLKAGDVIECGRFRVTVSMSLPDTDLLLEIAESISAREEQAQQKQQYRMRLVDTGLRKRATAWWLAALVLLPGLALPVVLRYGNPEFTGASLDRIWQAGPPSSAHSRFLTGCNACHERAFGKVRNDACLACHTDPPQHSDRPELLALPGMQDARCGACHLEHSGTAALHASDPGLCGECHAQPGSRFALARLEPARWFATEHPQFSPRVPRYEAGAGFRYLEAPSGNPAEWREETNLKFPHAVHLNPAGIRGREGLKVLECDACHVPERRGERFKPVTMEAHCAGCHRLDFDPDEPDRVLPHTQAREVAQVIRDHYARRALAGNVRDDSAPEAARLRRRPGEVLTPEQSQAALQWAEGRAARIIDEVFERRACADCHVVERTDPAAPLPWRIAPVALTSSHLTGAQFDHGAHRTEDCTRCHLAPESKTSNELLLPSLASCRECHGDPDSTRLVPSACVDCHSFHMAGQASFGLAAPEPDPP